MSDRDALNAYMREWRARPEVRTRERAKAAARSRALTRLADEHPRAVPGTAHRRAHQGSRMSASRTHTCPGGCGAGVPYAQLSCKPCWFRLPKPVRDDINAAYRRRRTDPLPHLRAIAEASRWYRANPLEDA